MADKSNLALNQATTLEFSQGFGYSFIYQSSIGSQNLKAMKMAKQFPMLHRRCLDPNPQKKK